MTDDFTILPPTEKGKQLSEIWSEGFMKMGRMYGAAWKEGILNHQNLAFLNSIRDVLVIVYYEMVRLGTLEEIGKLSKEEKAELKKLAHEYGKELSIREKINYCRALWAVVNQD